MYISHFSCFSEIFALFKSIKCLCLIFHFFQFCHHFPVQQCVFLIFHVFHCFSPYCRPYNICVSFSTLFSSYTMYFSYFKFSLLLATFQVLECVFLIFHVFDFFLPYSRSNFVCVTFSTVFQFSCHIPGLTVNISLFSRFSVFLSIFQVIHCFSLIFYVFQFFHQKAGSTVCIYHIALFSMFLVIF